MIRISFKKLLDGEYSHAVELEVLNWMLKTGQKYNERVARWSVDGVSKQIFGYSANSHNDVSFPFPIKCDPRIGNASFSCSPFDMFLHTCFYNAIMKPASSPVLKWRNDERIGVCRSRVLNIDDGYMYVKHDSYGGVKSTIQDFRHLIGEPLKKEYFQANYKDRTEPKIINVVFTTNGYGYMLILGYSFKEYKYEAGWDHVISQISGEGIVAFLNRVLVELDELLIKH